ncbi:hypothetical protein BGZ67_007106 [Mortierella alpina]|nr:hypothetical protein BGZ67_007106 [Mortierella alpina]
MDSTGPIIITLAFILLVGFILSCVRRRRAMALQQQYLAQRSQVTELGAIPEVYTNYAYQYPPPAGSPHTAYAPPPTASPYFSSAPVAVPAQTYTAYPPMPQTLPSSRPGPYYVPPQDGSAASAPNASSSANGSSQNPEETAMPPPPYSAVVKY